MRMILSPNENNGLKIMIRVYPGDIAHPNETYPWEVKQNYRYLVRNFKDFDNYKFAINE